MSNSRRFVFPALIIAGLLWGTTVPLSKLALDWMAPAWLAFARFALAAIVLMVASRSRLRAACSPAILVSGAAGYGGSVLLQNLGIERTSVTHAALLIGATPVLVAIMAAALRHSVARPVAWAGFALSLAGVGLVAGGQGGGSSLGGDALVLASQLASAGFTVSQARLLRGRDPIAVTGLQLMAAAAAMLPIALTTESLPSSPPGAVTLFAVIGLVLAGTVLPTSLFAFGQSRVSADVAGAFLNLEPLVGAVVGMALFADPLGPVQAAGCAAIMAGIGLSTFQVMRSERLRRATARNRAVPAPAPGPKLACMASSAGTSSSAGTPGTAGTPATAGTPGTGGEQGRLRSQRAKQYVLSHAKGADPARRRSRQPGARPAAKFRRRRAKSPRDRAKSPRDRAKSPPGRATARLPGRAKSPPGRATLPGRAKARLLRSRRPGVTALRRSARPG
jgi:O-acetylserine/cysteine efflux transporter